MDLDNLEVGMNDEDYDTINAPQFLDFSLLGVNSDDEEADRFFGFQAPQPTDEVMDQPTEATPETIDLPADETIFQPVSETIDQPANEIVDQLGNVKIDQENGEGEGMNQPTNEAVLNLPNKEVKSQPGNEPTMKRKIEAKITEPRAPHFATEDRIRERQEKKAAAASLALPVSPKEAGKKSGPSSIASSTRSYRPPTPKKTLPLTKVQPFSFAARDEEMSKKKKEQKMQQAKELEKMESFKFHAKPLPSFKPKLPKKMLIEVTNIEPFKLKSHERGAMYQQAWKSKIEQEEREMKENKIFHANPPTVLYKKPFEPVLGTLPLAEPLDIQLNTDKRTHERVLYEEQMREKEQEGAEQREMEEALRKEKEKQEEIELRKRLVHKARPLKPLRAFQLKSSDKPLTNPQSPAFAPLPSQRRGLEKGKFPSNGGRLNTSAF